jgi:Fur family ferric uptake transcriptional regulator
LRPPTGQMTLSVMSGTPRPLKDDDVRRLLASRGIRVTEQRLVLLRELARLRAPTSHPELTERMSRSGLDRATIYRNLLSLAKAGLLVRTQLGDAVWRYELPRGAELQHGRHPHFVCTDCGDVACLSSRAVSLGKEVGRRQISEVQLRGRCDACVRL